jgi:flagellin FlaB
MNQHKHNIKCRKCGYEWYTRSVLRKVTCPSCNQKTRNTTLKRSVKKLVMQKRAIIGLESAIVLIAFVIIAAAFSFMVVNQGLFATERGKTIIQQGLKQSSTPLTIDGTSFIRINPNETRVDVLLIPVKAFGVKYVSMGTNQTAVTLTIGEKSWPTVYYGVLYNNKTGKTYDPGAIYNTTDNNRINVMLDDFVGFTMNNVTHHAENGTYGDGSGLITGAALVIINSNHDEALDTGEKAYLVITLSAEDSALAREDIYVEIRLEESATLSIELRVPASMPLDSWATAG